MNKIYKVIWSKVRNCYVAVSEIAKRNGKNCTSVNCGAKANRRSVGVALAIALSLSMASGGVAWGAEATVTTDTEIPNTTYVVDSSTIDFTLAGEAGAGITFTVNNGGKVKSVISTQSGNTIIIQSGAEVVKPQYVQNWVLVGGISNNNITVAGSVLGGYVLGGKDSGGVTNNTVTVSGTVGNDTSTSYLHGGHSTGNGNVTSNSVEINGGTVKGEVYGGYTYQGNAGGTGQNDGNTVTINGGTVSKDVFGGYVHRQSGSAVNNSVTVSGSSKIGTSTSGTTIYSVYGGKTNNGSATQNTVTINLTAGETTEETGKIYGYVYGGHSSGSGAVTKNTVTIEAGTVNVEVYGGYSTSGNAGAENARNIVNITNGNASTVYGGKSGSGSASYNTVNITNGSAVYVYGGITDSSTTGGASHNIVSLTDSVVGGAIYGGSSKGNVTDNVVTINKGSYEGIIFGGYGRSTAGVSGNKVIISDGNLIGGQAFGGYHAGSGNVTGNSLTISGGTINKDIYGGEAYSGNATDNTVVISGGSFTGNRSIYGGAQYNTSDEKTVDGNVITIAGGSFTDKKNIYGGSIIGSDTVTPITNNTVNLYGTVTGLTNAHFYGAYYKSDSTIMGTGNEFHIGGTKTAAMLAESTSAAAWTGTTDNKVASVNNFNSIVLHNVNWSTTTPVLAAGNFSNIGLLDVSNIELQGELSLGTMALLQLVTDSASGSLNQTNLTYKDTSGDTKTNQNVAKAEISISPSLTGLGTNAVIHTGVKADYDGIAVVERKSDGKSINLTIAPEFKSVTLGEMNWADGGYSFSTPGRITGDGLAVTLDNFKVTGAEDQINGATMNLLDLYAAGGTIAGSPGTSVTVSKTNQAVTTDNKLKFSWNRTDTVAKNSDGNKLVYTTGATSNVTKATFDGAITWNTETLYDANGKGYIYRNNKFQSDGAVKNPDRKCNWYNGQSHYAV